MVVTAAKDWLEDKAPRLAAALSYYTAFSLPPFLVLIVSVGGLLYGSDRFQGQLTGQIAQLVGDESASLLDGAISEARATGSGAAVLVGIGALLLGATGVFGQLQDALNTIWEASRPKTSGFWSLIRSRVVSLAAVFVTGFLLLVSLAVSALIGGIVETANQVDVLAPMLVSLDLLASVAVISVMFAEDRLAAAMIGEPALVSPLFDESPQPERGITGTDVDRWDKGFVDRILLQQAARRS